MTREDQRLLPSPPFPESSDTSPRVLDLTSDDADLIFDALASTTARRILATLHEESAAPAEIAEQLDLSLQNVHYHLRNLQDANLIEEVDTGYSEKGVEMSIYAPTVEPVVLSGGDSDERARLRNLLEQLVGIVTIFGLISMFAHVVISNSIPFIESSDPPTPDSTPTPDPTPVPKTFQPEPLVPSGAVFFISGLIMLVLVIGWWYYRSHQQ